MQAHASWQRGHPLPHIIFRPEVRYVSSNQNGSVPTICLVFLSPCIRAGRIYGRCNAAKQCNWETPSAIS